MVKCVAENTVDYVHHFALPDADEKFLSTRGGLVLLRVAIMRPMDEGGMGSRRIGLSGNRSGCSLIN